MGLKRIVGLLSVLIIVGTLILVAALTNKPAQSAPLDDFRFEASALKDGKVWTQVNAEPYYISSFVDDLCRAPGPMDYDKERKKNPHASSFITVYVNEVGRAAMFAKESPRFPQGSVIVKEKIGITDRRSEGRTLLLYTLMRKREPGYNPTVGDWEFMVVAANGKLEASGKLENCQQCHTSKNDSDFVFRPYVNSK